MRGSCNTEKKLLHFDIALLITFVFFALLTLVYVLYQILMLISLGTVLHWLICAIAVITTLTMSISVFEVVKYLRNNTIEVYKEELKINKGSGMRSRFDFAKLCGVVFDTFFILVLCMSILLVTMLITKDSLSGGETSGYSVNAFMLCTVILFGLGYLYYMIQTSLSEYDRLLGSRYDAEKTE